MKANQFLIVIAAAFSLAACDKNPRDRDDLAKENADVLRKDAEAVKAEEKADAHAIQAAAEDATKKLKEKAEAARDKKESDRGDH